MYSNNFHANRFDMNVHYDKIKARRASIIRKNEAQKKLEKEQREKFQRDIRQMENGEEGRLGLLALKRLNTIQKKDYADMIIEESEEVKAYVTDVEEKLANKMDEVVHLKMKIDDTNDEWDSAIERLNAALTKKALKHGIEKNYYTKTNAFNIVDLVK